MASSSAASTSVAVKLKHQEDEEASDLDKRVLDIFKRLVSAADKQTKENVPTPNVERSEKTELEAGTTVIFNVSSAVQNAAAEIQQLCPLIDKTDELEVYLMTLWETVILVAKAIPSDSPLQDELVAVLQCLRLRAKATIEVWGKKACLWRDLPLFSAMMREAWFEPDPEATSETSIEEYALMVLEWINLNAFSARIMEKGLLSWTVYAVMAIGTALERYPPISLSSMERDKDRKVEHREENRWMAEEALMFFKCQVNVASQWIFLSGSKIFRDAFHQNILNETELAATSPGPLYMKASKGTPELNMERWRFWQKRFVEIGSDESKQAAQYMEDIVKEDARAIVRWLGTKNEDGENAERVER